MTLIRRDRRDHIELWTLDRPDRLNALPDPEDPVTHVWAEASSDAEARRLAQEYGRRIRQMLR